MCREEAGQKGNEEEVNPPLSVMPRTLYIHEPVRDLPRLSRRGFPPETLFYTDLSEVVEDAMHESVEHGGQHVVIQVEASDDVLGVKDADIENALYEDETPQEESVWEDIPEDSEEGRYEAGEAEYYEEEEEEYEEEDEYEEEEEEEYEEEEEEGDLWSGDDAVWHRFTGAVEEGVVTISLPMTADNQVDREHAGHQELAWFDEMSARGGEVKERVEGPDESQETEWEEEVDEDWPKTLNEAIELTESATLISRIPPENALVLGEAAEVFEEDLTPEERAKGMWYRFPTEPQPLVEFRSPFWRSLIRKLILGY